MQACVRHEARVAHVTEDLVESFSLILEIPVLNFHDLVIVLFLGQVFAVDKFVESDYLHGMLKGPLHIVFALESLFFACEAFAPLTWLLGSFLELLFVDLDI